MQLKQNPTSLKKTKQLLETLLVHVEYVYLIFFRSNCYFVYYFHYFLLAAAASIVVVILFLNITETVTKAIKTQFNRPFFNFYVTLFSQR